MKRYVSPNFIKASNLILVTVGLGIINFLLSGSLQSAQMGIAIFAITTLFVTGLLIRKGYVWAKWVFTVFVALGLLVTIFIIAPDGFKLNSLSDYISDLQLIIQVVAAVMLFIPTKQPLIDISTQSDII
jgi:lysylphosphatidylglycerol synthetase-like protein (DUF2156 family)